MALGRIKPEADCNEITELRPPASIMPVANNAPNFVITASCLSDNVDANNSLISLTFGLVAGLLLSHENVICQKNTCIVLNPLFTSIASIIMHEQSTLLDEQNRRYRSTSVSTNATPLHCQFQHKRLPNEQ
jgi:hypothetical protein